MTEGQDPRLEAVARALWRLDCEAVGAPCHDRDFLLVEGHDRYMEQARAALAAADAVAGGAEEEGAVGYANIYRWDGPVTPDDGDLSGFSVGDGDLCATASEAAQTAYGAEFEPERYVGVAKVVLLHAAPSPSEPGT